MSKDDMVSRLRHVSKQGQYIAPDIIRAWCEPELAEEAATRITALEAEVGRLTEANEALMRERTSLIETKREQIETLTAERDAALAEIERMTPKFVAYEYLESPAGREIAEAKLKLAEAALSSVSNTSHRARDRRHYRFPIEIMERVDGALHSIREE